MGAKSYAARAILQSAAAADGNGTPMDAAGLRWAVFQVKGITTATINWEATINGTDWVAVLATNQTSGTAATTAAADGLFGMNCAGYAQVRSRISGYSAGTITVTGLALSGG